jgi:hypothetical protein
MPLVNFRPAPGINKEVTDYTGEGKWTDGDNVRFFQGLPQKIKGWEKLSSSQPLWWVWLVTNTLG